MAGIDTDKFGAHSTRAASSSAATRGGVPVSDILNTGGWSSEKTFAKHYNLKIGDSNTFRDAVYNC